MSNIRIVVVGAAGRMGRTLIRQVSQTPGCEISGATEPSGSEFLGRDAGALAGLDALGIAITDDPLELIAKANAVLDFTSPAAAAGHAALCAQARIVHVIGTTGLKRNTKPPLPPPRATPPSSRRAICRWGSICWRN